MDFTALKHAFQNSVMPTYGRYDVGFVEGEGSFLYDTAGKKYLDLAAGIAVCALGHAHPELVSALTEQAKKLWHVSNLFYQEPQARLAALIGSRLGGGKVFFCNSGGEANEAIFKLARKFGNPEGRYEILTAENSFHGRTLAGITATGQAKVKVGFEPLVPGFRSIRFNDLSSAESAIRPETVAILIEGIQGEGGILPATPEYLLGLRELCDRHHLLLMMDSIQCGMFRSGSFQSYQRILEGHPRGANFRPDAISLAKGLGGGFPIGAMWAREGLCDVLGPGTHATTFGGNLLATAVAIRVFEVIERDEIAANVRNMGEYFRGELLGLRERFPALLKDVRGLGLMIGLELHSEAPAFAVEGKTPAGVLVSELLESGVVSVPAGNAVVRFVPPLNLSRSEVDLAIETLKNVLTRF